MFRIGLLLCLLPLFTCAQPGALRQKIEQVFQDTVPEDSNAVRNAYFILVPVPRYLPETRWGLVLAGNYVFRTHKDFLHTRPSSLRLSATYTQNRQYIVKPTLELFTPDNRWLLRTGFLWMRFPELYYGWGGNTPRSWEEPYSFDMSRIFFRLYRRMSDYLYAGVSWQYEHMYRMVYSDSSRFITQPVTGNRGGVVSGPGISFIWDSRKNIYFPAQGVFLEYFMSFYTPFTGSQFRYATVGVDFRAYLPFRKSKDVWAFQIYSQWNPGNPPFRQMGLLGGENLGRGFYQGRFRDKNHLVLQSEYRLKVWKRFGMTVFSGLATVYPGSVFQAYWHPFGGIGFRGKLLRKEYLNVRLDIGFGQGLRNYYFTLDEAF